MGETSEPAFHEPSFSETELNSVLDSLKGDFPPLVLDFINLEKTRYPWVSASLGRIVHARLLPEHEGASEGDMAVVNFKKDVYGLLMNELVDYARLKFGNQMDDSIQVMYKFENIEKYPAVINTFLRIFFYNQQENREEPPEDLIQYFKAALAALK
jgi:hypothetical protein